MPTPPPRPSTPPTHPGFSPKRPKRRGPGTLVSAPWGGEEKKKTRESFPWRLFPPGSGVTWALGRLAGAGAGTRWNLWTGRGDAGKWEEARQPESERCRGPLKRGRRYLPLSPAGPGPLYNRWWGFCLCGCLFCGSHPTAYPHSESEVFPRSRHLPLALSASSVPQRACLGCPCLLLCLRKESQRRAPLLAGCQPFAKPN